MRFECGSQLADAIHLALADAVAEQFERCGGTLRPLRGDHVAHEREMRARQRYQLVRNLPALRGTGELRQPIELTVERALGGVVRREGLLLSREHVTLYAVLGILQRREHDADLIERRAPMEDIEIGDCVPPAARWRSSAALPRQARSAAT